MTKLAVRILLLLAVLALGRVVVEDWLNLIEHGSAVAVVAPGCECVLAAFAADSGRGN